MLTPQQMRARMSIPKNLRKAYPRIIVAGMKVMFSDETNNLMMQQLKQSPDMVKNLSEGIAGLMAILWKESKGKMPQQLIVPASLELLAHAIEYVTKENLAEITPEIEGAAMEATVYAVLQRFNVSKEQATQALQQMSAKGPR